MDSGQAEGVCEVTHEKVRHVLNSGYCIIILEQFKMSKEEV